jgi:hypothetical protein
MSVMTLLLSNQSPLENLSQRDRQLRANFYLTIPDLISTYLDLDRLNNLLKELPQQFQHPQPRKWARIDWQSINSEQIIGIEPQLFLAILKGSIDTEAPIRDYTQTSRQYLDAVHPQMAQYVGGTIDNSGNTRSTKGLWELEERRHAPALMAVYHQLSGQRIQPHPKQARTYQPHNSPADDLYRHGLHRIATEYGATCLYLWLMGHSTGTLRQVLGELVQDEVNHLIKFWGFGIWLYPYSKGHRFIHGCCQMLPQRSTGNNLLKTYQQMMSVMHWSEWKFQQRWLVVLTFYLVMQRLLAWHHSNTPAAGDLLFGTSPTRSTPHK